MARPRRRWSSSRTLFAGPRTAVGALIGLAIGVFVPEVGRAELFSWVDDDGVLHLTNVRPSAKYRPYGSAEGEEDVEGFGGDKPVVLLYPSGQERVVYRVDVATYDDLLARAASHYGLPFAFVKAVAKVESNFNPRAVSHANAKGLMQLIDDTARLLNVTDPFDPTQNVFGGARYLRMLANEFDGNMALVAAAYNAGPERVRKRRRVPEIRETQRYVERVLQMYRHYRRTS